MIRRRSSARPTSTLTLQIWKRKAVEASPRRHYPWRVGWTKNHLFVLAKVNKLYEAGAHCPRPFWAGNIHFGEQVRPSAASLKRLWQGTMSLTSVSEEPVWVHKFRLCEKLTLALTGNERWPYHFGSWTADDITFDTIWSCAARCERHVEQMYMRGPCRYSLKSRPIFHERSLPRYIAQMHVTSTHYLPGSRMVDLESCQ